MTPPNGTKKVGSGEYVAAGPDQDTIPSPPDSEENVSFQLAELKAATLRVSELASELVTVCARWELQLNRVRMAALTSEHKLNVQRSKIVAGGRVLIAHERELRDIKARLEKIEGPGVYSQAAPEGAE